VTFVAKGCEMPELVREIAGCEAGRPHDARHRI
jgi:hypothetical protein